MRHPTIFIGVVTERARCRRWLDDFTIDLAAKRVRKGTTDIPLMATEWQVVEILARNPGKLITQRQLLEQVWGLADAKTNYVRVFMVAIRKKLEPDPAHLRYFLPEPGSKLWFIPEGMPDHVDVHAADDTNRALLAISWRANHRVDARRAWHPSRYDARAQEIRKDG